MKPTYSWYNVFLSIFFYLTTSHATFTNQLYDQQIYEQQTTSFVVIIPSYNNSAWYKKNLDALFAQEKNYTNWRAIYIDDCSTDETGKAVAEYIAQKGFSHKITVIHNIERKGALANQYYAIHSCHDNEVIVTYDGDDWFACDDVLTYLNSLYSNTDVWATYGQYQEFPDGKIGICKPFPDWVVQEKAYRRVTWVSSHPRTFYAWLFKLIKKEDLLFEGKFFPMTCDLAIMFPILEMAGSHVRYIDKVLYIYNLDNPINDWKKDIRLLLYLDHHIRNMPSYKTIY